LEQIVPIAWEQVAGALDVAKRVKRCGIRFLVLWKTDTKDEAQKRVARSMRPPEDLARIVGEATLRGWSHVVEDHRGTLRIGLDVLETKIQGELQAQLAKLVPEFAVFLDLDHAFPGTTPLTIQKGGMKDFIRLSWQRTKEAAKLVRDKLGVDLAP